MKMNKEQFINTLILECKNNKIELTEEKAKKLYEYKELLVEWNQKINLTAITDDEEIIIKHFVDSLLVIPHIEENQKIIDVGTGAGFPGIVIAIHFEGKVSITLLDSLQKRIDFLEVVINDLKLKNIKAIHARAEELAHKEEHREKYDIAVARAVAPLNVLLEYLSGYVKVEGKCICMKGSNAEEEINNAKNATLILNLKMSSDNKKVIKCNEDIIRHILVYNKEKCTPSKYPRSYGKIKKSPL